MSTQHALHNRIGPLEHRLGLSDDALARAAGLSRAHLNRIKNGTIVPRIDTALAIARALGVSVAAVFQLTSRSNAR